METLRANRIKLLSLLQQASGDWASLLDLQAAEPQAAPQASAEPIIVEEEHPQVKAAEEFISINTFDDSVPADPGSADLEAYLQQTASSEYSSGNENIQEQFIELNAEEEDPMGMQQEAPAEYTYSRRSVIHDENEVKKASELPPVQKVLDLFNGEIVDIHV
jgi:hypothetical protein